VVNDLSKVIPKILALGQRVLRANAVTPRLVNRRYETEAGRQGSTIDVTIPGLVPAQDVVPGMGAPTSQSIAPTTVPIALSKWKEAPFELTDKEQNEILDGVLPLEAEAAVKSLCDAVDQDLLAQAYQSTWQFVGDANAYVPFDPTLNSGLGSTKTATDLNKVLHKGLTPTGDRHCVVTADVEANALQIRAFQDQSWSGDIEAIIKARLNDRLGFRWWMNQNLTAVAHTAGTLTGATGTGTSGSTTVAVSTGTAAVLNPGDLIKFANHTQIYVCRSAINLGATAGPISLTIAPALVTGVTAQAISHPTNFANGNVYYNGIAFSRNAIALVSRPFQPIPDGLGSVSGSITDEITGLTLRVELTRGNKTQRWSWDVLWGAAVLRPENVARLVASI